MNNSLHPESERRPEDPWTGEVIEPAPQPERKIEIVLPNNKPVVSYVILALTIIIFIAQTATEFLFRVDLPAAYLAKVNQAILAGQLWRLITPVLVHGNLMHILFNMYALNALGPDLERSYGSSRFLSLYALSGISGSLLSLFLTTNPSLGASSAIFGLIAAQIVFVYRNRELFGQQSRTVLIQLGMIVLINLGFGLTPGIDNWAHLGGLIGGGLFAWFAGPVLAPELYAGVVKLLDRTDKTRILLITILEFVVLLGITLAAVFLNR